MTLPYAVLLKDVNGHKKSEISTGFTEKYVNKGELLIALSPSEVKKLKHQVATGPQLNFKCHEDQTIAVHCDDEDVHLLNGQQKELLLAIDSVIDRHNAKNKLEWAEELTKGSEVYVAITSIPNTIKGIVRYCGELSGEKGTRFGIELMEHKSRGSSDGYFRGKEYFNCEKNCAVFVALDKLSLHPTVSMSTPGITSSKSKQALQLQQPIEQHQHHPMQFKRGDRVSVVNNTEDLVMGTVRWSGRGTGPKGNIVGIETDVAVNLNSYPKREVGMNHYFKPSNEQLGADVQLFLPYDCVIKEDASMNKGSSQEKDTSFPTQEPTKTCNEPLEAGSDLQAAKSYEKQKASSQSKMGEKEHSSTSTGLKNTLMKMHQNFQSLDKQVKQLKVDHDDQKISASNTITKLQEDTNEIAGKVITLEEMVKSNTDNIQRMNSTLNDVHKSNKELKALNFYLQDKLSLTQQQLLGIQSMITSSRLWAVSHDQFAIGKEIGRGAWATVHEATFRGVTVAVKCLHNVITSHETKELFKREMDMALICQHENIVTFLGATMEGAPVILMELMDVNLRKAYEQRHILDRQVLGILHDVAKAIHFLHTRPDPVIHRDVSSANVLLKVLYNGEWLAKLGDLGTAKIQQQSSTGGHGAMAYGAPEAADFRKCSPKMDVYSFGVVMIEILTKTHPFQKVDTLKAQVQQQYPQYYQLVTSCTKQQSSDRPTMYDVLVQLDRITAADK